MTLIHCHRFILQLRRERSGFTYNRVILRNKPNYRYRLNNGEYCFRLGLN